VEKEALASFDEGTKEKVVRACEKQGNQIMKAYAKLIEEADKYRDIK
jgi:hypothetical protein